MNTNSKKPLDMSAKRGGDQHMHDSEEERQEQEKKGKTARGNSSGQKGLKRKESRSSDNINTLLDDEAQEEGTSSRDDDYDDEDDDYDEEDDDVSHGSFIASEGDVEKELLEQREREERELRGENYEQRKKKKRKTKKIKKLDQEDIDLLGENTGDKRFQKKRRLQKMAEKEKIDMQEQAIKKKQFKDEVEEGQMSDDQPRLKQSRVQPSYRRQQQQHQPPDEHSQLLEKQRALQATQKEDGHEIAKTLFSDPNQLRAEINKKKALVGAGDDMETGGFCLGEIFDGNEIDDQYATKPDKLIADTDIPERLQLKLKERLNPSQDELADEAQWIFNRFTQDTQRNEFHSNGEAIKKKITKLLSLFRVEHLDIPMITMYRKYEFTKDLTEEDVWTTFTLDQEYGKFMYEKNQIYNFLSIVSQYNPEIKDYFQDLQYVTTQSQLNDFQKQITFLAKYYYQELNNNPNYQKKKVPIKNDKIQIYKQNKLDVLARECLHRPQNFVRNLQRNSMIYQPPEILDHQPVHVAQKYLSETYNEEIKVLTGVCQFAAEELGTEPYLRSLLKKEYCEKGFIETKPTEKGEKDMDIFNASYKVKYINKEPIRNFLKDDERFIDILRNVEAGLITLTIDIDQEYTIQFHQFLEQYYIHPNKESPWNLLRKEVLRLLQQKVLVADIVSEIKTELQEAAENCIIQKCQERFKALLMTGPFQCTVDGPQRRTEEAKRNKNRKEEIIKGREQLNVMGVVLHQLDQQNSIVTVAVVDQSGNVVAHKDFQHLMPPRKITQKKIEMMSNEEDKEKLKKIRVSQAEEQEEHKKDLDKLKALIYKNSVDLIVVGANKLEARRIFDTLREQAALLKNSGLDNEGNEGAGNDDDGDRKEAMVIWGSLEIPKLFSVSHQSQKLLESCNPVLKQCISLARFEQDPMPEILNLWSASPSENQVLQCNLHPMQRHINQAKFQDALENVAVQCVNDVGVDLNQVIDNEHLQSLLQFVSGLGPRKAKKLVHSIKQTGRKIETRGEIFKNQYLGKICYMSAIPFLKIRIPPGEETKNMVLDILDQTRIHQQSYVLALKVASDVINDSQQVEKYQQYQAVKEVIKNPKKLKEIDISQYRQELERSGQGNMTSILDQIIEELEHPFKDPREARTPTNLKITNDQLFYMMIDETDKTFKRGIIVTATVVRVLDDKVFCKLDNGVDGVVYQKDLIGANADNKVSDAIQAGHVIQGRIHEIKAADQKYMVVLKCRKEDLESHKPYLDEEQKELNPPEEDLRNHNFQIEKRIQNQSRYTHRRIQHPKFKNIPSTQAMAELKQKGEIGDYIFRPSSQGPNNLTLTWLFYTNCFVHIDIRETEKAVAASIGSKLTIGEDDFENLQEIIERYIQPCNKALREATSHPKFMNCQNIGDLEDQLKKEKAEDAHKIPYRVTILDIYPQHLVLGYIPKEKFCKEFIKIKPSGFFFHQKRHNPFQGLINWFKEHFKEREYQKEFKRAKSPRVKPNLPNPLADLGIGMTTRNPDQWNEVGDNWIKEAGGNSVHSMNDESSVLGKRMKQEQRGGWNNEGGDRENNNNKSYSMNNDSDQPRGRGRGICYNCNESGHMSRECPQPQKPRRNFNRDDNTDDQPNRGRGGRGRGRGSNFEEDKDNAPTNTWNNQSQEPSNWGGAQSNNSPQKVVSSGWGTEDAVMKNESKSPATNWGATGSNTPKQNKSPVYEANANSGWGATTEPVATGGNTTGWGDNNASANAWGQSTPKQTDNAGWGNNNDTGGMWGNTNNDGSPKESGYDDSRASRGRGRGGAGRGGFDSGASRPSGECYKCHQEGHMARSCPNSTGPNAGSSRACFKCGEDGHQARECPNPDTRPNQSKGRGGPGGGGSRACFKCGEEGHMSRECTNPSTQAPRERRPMTCFNCQQEGHHSRDCTEPRKPREDGGGFGRGRGRGEPNRPCYKCHQEGHFANQCPSGGDNDGGAPYKRQRNDYGSTRRYGDNQGNDNNNASSGGNAWGDNNAGGGSNDWNAGSNAWGDNNANQPASNNNGWDSGPTQSQAQTSDWGQASSSNNNTQQQQNSGWG